jgi:hypothetical protein
MNDQEFYETRTSTLTYVAFDEEERVGVVIDSVLDFDAPFGRTWNESADQVARLLEARRIRVPCVLEHDD